MYNLYLLSDRQSIDILSDKVLPLEKQWGGDEGTVDL